MTTESLDWLDEVLLSETIVESMTVEIDGLLAQLANEKARVRDLMAEVERLRVILATLGATS